jgi:hypothetical protein
VSSGRSAPGSLPWFGHFVANFVKVSLDFGHVQVLIHNLAGTDQGNIAFFQPRSQGLTYET